MLPLPPRLPRPTRHWSIKHKAETGCIPVALGASYVLRLTSWIQIHYLFFYARRMTQNDIVIANLFPSLCHREEQSDVAISSISTLIPFFSSSSHCEICCKQIVAITSISACFLLHYRSLRIERKLDVAVTSTDSHIFLSFLIIIKHNWMRLPRSLRSLAVTRKRFVFLLIYYFPLNCCPHLYL